MTRDEFEQEYASRSGLTLDELHFNMDRYATPCNCGEPECRGWQMRNLSGLLHSELNFETEHIPEDWDGQDLIDALIADGRTNLLAAFRLQEKLVGMMERMVSRPETWGWFNGQAVVDQLRRPSPNGPRPKVGTGR